MAVELDPLARPLPAGRVGPGSQPQEADGTELNYVAMPGAMQTYRQPPLPEPEDAASCAAGLATLEALHKLLAGHRAGASPQLLDLAGLPERDRRLVEDSLGEGEVSALRRAAPGAADPEVSTTPDGADLAAQETRLAGVWRVRGAGRDELEVADVPGFVRAGAFTAPLRHIPLPQALPEGVMNAPGVLTELLEQVQVRADGTPHPAHVVNLTLLPQSEQDLAWLGDQLGHGEVSILSRGYGNCRITATALRGVWWVQYFNSDDRLILNTLEVTDVPAAALAAQEDIDDSAERLREILGALTESA